MAATGGNAAHEAPPRAALDPVAIARKMEDALARPPECVTTDGAKLLRDIAQQTVSNAREAGVDESLIVRYVEEMGLLPQIQCNGRTPIHVRRDALAALYAANKKKPSLFRRGTGICRIIHDEKGRPVVGDVGPREMKHHLTRVANFYNLYLTQAKNNQDVTKRSHAARVIYPPDALVGDVLALSGWDLPPLDAICEIPVLRPDGTIVSQPGYDRETALYHQPEAGLEVPAIPEHPSSDDVHAALALIREAIGEFPFVDDASYANALALLLTPVVRPMIDGNVPLALLDKPAAGTGASLLARVLALIVAGGTKREINQTDSEEEWRKAITTALSAGATVVLIDNVDGNLRSSSIARALTNTTWEDRLLGQNDASAAIRVPNRATWLCTGNNVKLRGDIARRTYWIRLDARVARPWQRRSFVHANLMDWAQKNRGELLAAVLTIARSWVVAGMPLARGGFMGGFDGWERVIGGILAHAGVTGFLGNLDRMYEEADQEDSQWDDFLELLRRHLPYPKGALAIAEMIQQEGEGSELKDKLPPQLAEKLDARSGAFATVIGQQFSSREGKRFGDHGLRLERGRNGKKKSNLWRVVRDGDPAATTTNKDETASGEAEQAAWLQ
jgi:hypothetical protein